MAQKTDKRGTGCPITFALDTFGDRWTLLIIRDIMVHGKRTYSDFMQADEQISSNILISRLKQLESDGIVLKTRDPNNHRSFVYDLTAKGFDLAPVLIEIIRWSGAYDHSDVAIKALYDLIGQDRQAFETKLRAPLQDRKPPD